MGHILEALMMICFGISWPFSLARSYRARSAKGKSIVFLLCIIIGYAFGIVAKIVNHDITYVLAFYCINFLMVSADLVIWFRNKQLDTENAKTPV